MQLTNFGEFRPVRAFPRQPTWTRLVVAEREPVEPGGGAPQQVLLKIHPAGEGELFERIRAQFLHESKLLEAFSHPSIPSHHGGGEQEGTAWYAMELIEGVDLAALLWHGGDEPRGLSKEIAVYIGGQIADILDHIHCYEELQPNGEYASLAVLHRDISPSNILLSVHGDVLLTDFGAATSTWLDRRYDARDAGSKAYMAPERIIGGGEASIKTDLFALAVVLWEVLKGQRCFWQGDDLRTMEAIARFDIAQPSRRISGLSPRLSEVIRKNLDRDPQRRFSDAYQVLQRLAQSAEAAQAEQARHALAELVIEAVRERDAG